MWRWVFTSGDSEKLLKLLADFLNNLKQASLTLINQPTHYWTIVSVLLCTLAFRENDVLLITFNAVVPGLLGHLARCRRVDTPPVAQTGDKRQPLWLTRAVCTTKKAQYFKWNAPSCHGWQSITVHEGGSPDAAVIPGHQQLLAHGQEFRSEISPERSEH